MLRVRHLNGILVSHVPEPDQTVSRGAADQCHVVVGGQAVDRLVERFFPGPELKVKLF